MKKTVYLLAALLCVAVNYGCGGDDDGPVGNGPEGEVTTGGTDKPGTDKGEAGALSIYRGIKFRTVKAGSFTHGNALHTISKDYRLSECEITNAQYCAFLNACKVGEGGTLSDEPSFKDAYTVAGKTLIYDSSKKYDGDYNWGCVYNVTTSKWEPASGYADYPVIWVTWYGAKAFCLWLGGDLPTEAQWELACQGNECTDATTWYYDNSNDRIHPVGQKLAGANGLRDMLGNVEEWCADWYDITYEYGTYMDYVGPTSGSSRVCRGGSWWNSGADFCTPARRYSITPDGSYDGLGFRACLP